MGRLHADAERKRASYRMRRPGCTRYPAFRDLLLIPLLFACAAPGVADELVRERLERAAPALFAPAFLASIYERRRFELLWDDARAQQLLTLIDDAPTHGLVADNYLRREIRAFGALRDLDSIARTDVDLLLTEALLRYGYHLRFGKVDPRALDANWNYTRAAEFADPVGIVADLVAATDLAAAMAPLVRHGPLYDRLRDWLAHYQALVDGGGWSPVPEGRTLRRGDDDPRVRALRSRLAAEGFAPADLESTRFDADLEKRVEEWQFRHGLGVDGAVGPRSLAAMNVAAADLVARLRVNLERMRWIAEEPDHRFLAVNIAGYSAYFIEERALSWSARAVVGRPYRQTPVFRAEMTYLVFNPDWTIPPTILRQDTLPAIRKNPNYLEENHMDVITATGRPVDPSTIDWTRFPRERFPYFVRQRPGPWNALGRVKFIFPNDHFVFLHDTPAKTLFEQSERTFSSGCIRIERPFVLAGLLLRDQAPWTPEEIERQVESGDTKTVFLRRPVPVLILYLTAIDVEGGRFQFHRDIYGRDAAVLAALDAPPGSGGAEMGAPPGD